MRSEFQSVLSGFCHELRLLVSQSLKRVRRHSAASSVQGIMSRYWFPSSSVYSSLLSLLFTARCIVLKHIGRLKLLPAHLTRERKLSKLMNSVERCHCWWICFLLSFVLRLWKKRRNPSGVFLEIMWIYLWSLFIYDYFLIYHVWIITLLDLGISCALRQTDNHWFLWLFIDSFTRIDLYACF